MDTSIHVAHGMMWEWEATALGEQLDTQIVGAPWAQSGGREYPDHNTIWVDDLFILYTLTM